MVRPAVWLLAGAGRPAGAPPGESGKKGIGRGELRPAWWAIGCTNQGAPRTKVGQREAVYLHYCTRVNAWGTRMKSQREGC